MAEEVNRISELLRNEVLAKNPTRDELRWILRYGPALTKKEAGQKLLVIGSKEDIRFVYEKVKSLSRQCAAAMHRQPDLSIEDLRFVIERDDGTYRASAADDLFARDPQDLPDLLRVASYSLKHSDEAWAQFLERAEGSVSALESAYFRTALREKAWKALLEWYPQRTQLEAISQNSFRATGLRQRLSQHLEQTAQP